MSGIIKLMSFTLIINILIFGLVSYIIFNIYQFVMITIEIKDIEHKQVMEKLRNIENKINGQQKK